MGRLLKSISIRRPANLHTKICLKKKDKTLNICYLFWKKIMLERAPKGNWQYFVMGYHEHIWLHQCQEDINSLYHFEIISGYVHNSSHNCVGNNIVVLLLVLVRICHIITQRCFMLCTTYTNFWFIVCPLEVRCFTPLSKIFQLLLFRRKLEYPEKSTDLSQVTDKLYHILLYLT
jgi:hypothetical protein